ncbi:replication initiation and membrane attachment family protein [Chungangia koreensis]|uniref:Replication initiation and membrane attachment family protein n=1 Tax=Chungangia koreensis TaxID=752657 RepID=A0ABV8X6W4_9LACT
MITLYKEVQPADPFVVRLPYPFSDYDRQMLTLFYQPLVGAQAMSLYLTLWADAEQAGDKEFTHYYLMNSLDLPIGKIFEARISLEAIGLLQTWKKEEDNNRSFTYELLGPLDAKTFFDDALLSVFLFNRIGEHAYKRLKDRFLKPEVEMEGYEDISRSFLDVFQPSSRLDQFKQDQVQYAEAKVTKGIPFQYEFDFSLLFAGLSEQMIPTKAFNARIKETVKRLAFLYSFTPIDMQKVVLLALDDNFSISEDLLKKAAADYYKLATSKDIPYLKKSFVQTPEIGQPMQKEQLSKEEELLQYLETTPPAQVLKDMQGGKEPLPADVLFAQQLVMNHQMPVGVVNVLLQYVLLRTDMKLTKNYAEKIASHWIRKNVQTAKEAMTLARKEHSQYLQWKNDGGKKAAPAKKAVREEKVPEWFYKKQQSNVQEPVSGQINVEEERKKLLAELGVLKDEVKK